MTPDPPKPPEVFPEYQPPVPPPAGFATLKQSGQLYKIMKFMAKPRLKARVSKPKKGLAKKRKSQLGFR